MMAEDKLENEETISLPEGWVWTTLEELAINPQQDIVDGPFGSDLKASEYVDRGIPIIRLQNIDRNFFIDKNIKFVTEEKSKELERHSFVNGDIVITKLGDPLGEACEVPSKYGYGIIVADIVRVRLPWDLINKKYITYGINSPTVAKQFSKATKGTTRPRVNLNFVRGINIPLPPLPEQHRIVAKIEELFTQLDASEAALQRAKANLERYRRSVLQAAVTGELTREWRKKFSRNDPWRILRLDEIGTLNRGKSKHRPRNAEFLYGGPYPFIQTGDVKQAKGVIREYSQTYSEEGLKQSRIWPAGTLCITIAANIAETAILDFDACFPDSVVGFISKPELCDTQYIEYFFRTAKSNIERFAPATAQKNINLNILSKLEIPLPPLDEQKQLVSMIDEKFNSVEISDLFIIQSLHWISRLRQSILTEAFTGRLVEQNPEDEPASVLLRRIQAERSARPPRTKRKPKANHDQ